MAVFDGQAILGVAYGVDCNTAADTFVAIPSGQKGVYFTGCYVTNATANLSSSTSTLGVYTQTAAGGTAVVTAATGNITSNTTASYVKSATIASSTSALTLNVSKAPATVNGAANNEAGVYVQIAGTPNTAGKVDVYLVGYVFG